MSSLTENRNAVLESAIRESLRCSICHEQACNPVKPTCCESAKSLAPSCLRCVREYCQLNRRPSDRPYHLKSWVGCGCSINPQNVRQRTNPIYSYTKEYDILINTLGPSVCPNCGVELGTVEELRRHLSGTATPGDKHGNCMEAMTCCQEPGCKVFGKRSFILGEHKKKEHSYFVCPICTWQNNSYPTKIKAHLYDSHFKIHQAQFNKLKEIGEQEEIKAFRPEEKNEHTVDNNIDDDEDGIVGRYGW